MTDLTTTYLGLELTSPLVASAGPLTGRLDTLERLAAAGAAAVVLPSLFEEDVVGAAVERQQLFTQGTDAFAEALTYLPEPEGTDELDRHLQLVADAKANPDDTATSLEVELLRLVRAVRDEISVPLAVKISPFFTAVSHFVGQVAAAGADGVVCFNRFYQPDLDLESLDVTPTLDLSTSAELRLPLRWVALLSGRVACSLALSTGVHTSDDVVKALLAGADVVMATSSLLVHGPEHLETLRRGLAAWLEDHEYESVTQARGSVSARSVSNPAAYERANYRRVLRRFASNYEV